MPPRSKRSPLDAENANLLAHPPDFQFAWGKEGFQALLERLKREQNRAAQLHREYQRWLSLAAIEAALENATEADPDAGIPVFVRDLQAAGNFLGQLGNDSARDELEGPLRGCGH